MATCCGPVCDTVTFLNPDAGTGGESVDEHGNVLLTIGVGIVNVTFNTVKAGDYRFEYLYVDALGPLSGEIPGQDVGGPEIIALVPVTQTIYGFTVDLGAYPIQDGYILRWRVRVVDFVVTPGSLVDAPESIRVQLTQTPTFSVTFTNPRSTTSYGFTELRVENLVDLPADQTPILPQVVQKTLTGFTVALSPSPDTDNYYLVIRTP